MLRDNKGQTAIEILIVTAVVIIIATLIGFYLKTRTAQIANSKTDDLQNITDQIAGN